jgi:signal transduction histidine kinase
VKLRFELDCPCRVTISPTRVGQVLTNLVVNACNAVAPNGNVTVRTGATGEGMAELVVEDDGPGMDSGTLGQVFEEFFTTRGDGTGLGLSIVRAVVDAAGGRVEVRSELGKGAMFRVLLPEFNPSL